MLRVRTYGASGPAVAVVHGGPGAPGSARGIADGLADGFRVLEPFQRPSGGEPLTVARHVADLAATIEARFPSERVALVGHSWGAVLVLATAAARPDLVARLVLVGCATLDPAARARFREAMASRTTPDLARRFAEIERSEGTPDERLAARARLLDAVYAVDPLPREGPEDPVDARSNRETWGDALRLEAEGVHPAAFARVACPVLLLHGAEDPHPGPMIRDALARHVPALAYREFPRCGHEPWRERAARGPFFDALRAFLAAPRAGPDPVRPA